MVTVSGFWSWGVDGDGIFRACGVVAGLGEFSMWLQTYTSSPILLFLLKDQEREIGLLSLLKSVWDWWEPAFGDGDPLSGHPNYQMAAETEVPSMRWTKVP